MKKHPQKRIMWVEPITFHKWNIENDYARGVHIKYLGGWRGGGAEGFTNFSKNYFLAQESYS